MGVLLKVLLLVALALVAQHIRQTLIHLVFPHHVYNHTPGPCRLIDNMVNGSEDIQMMSNGVAILTAGMKPFYNPSFGDRKGGLYLFDFNAPEAGVTALQVDGVDIDNPHGLSIWEQPDSNKVIIFVVHHLRSGKDAVERLELQKGQNIARYTRSITHPDIIYLNDVVASGLNSFYGTNVFGYKNRLMQWLEMNLVLNLGSIVHYDGKTVRIVADGIGSLNGINLSKDGRFLYVSSFVDRTLNIFNRMEEDGSLHHKEAYQLHTHPDNIDVSKDTGDLWIGCHPDLNKIAEQIGNPAVKVPSQVLHLNMEEGHVTSVKEVYTDDGDTLCGSSTAVYHKGALLIGTAFHKLLYCKVVHMD